MNTIIILYYLGPSYSQNKSNMYSDSVQEHSKSSPRASDSAQEHSKSSPRASDSAQEHSKSSPKAFYDLKFYGW